MEETQNDFDHDSRDERHTDRSHETDQPPAISKEPISTRLIDALHPYANDRDSIDDRRGIKDPNSSPDTEMQCRTNPQYQSTYQLQVGGQRTWIQSITEAIGARCTPPFKAARFNKEGNYVAVGHENDAVARLEAVHELCQRYDEPYQDFLQLRDTESLSLGNAEALVRELDTFLNKHKRNEFAYNYSAHYFAKELRSAKQLLAERPGSLEHFCKAVAAVAEASHVPRLIRELIDHHQLYSLSADEILGRVTDTEAARSGSAGSGDPVAMQTDRSSIFTPNSCPENRESKDSPHCTNNWLPIIGREQTMLDSDTGATSLNPHSLCTKTINQQFNDRDYQPSHNIHDYLAAVNPFSSLRQPTQVVYTRELDNGLLSHHSISHNTIVPGNLSPKGLSTPDQIDSDKYVFDPDPSVYDDVKDRTSGQVHASTVLPAHSPSEKENDQRMRVKPVSCFSTPPKVLDPSTSVVAKTESVQLQDLSSEITELCSRQSSGRKSRGQSHEVARATTPVSPRGILLGTAQSGDQPVQSGFREIATVIDADTAAEIRENDAVSDTNPQSENESESTDHSDRDGRPMDQDNLNAHMARAITYHESMRKDVSVSLRETRRVFQTFPPSEKLTPIFVRNDDGRDVWHIPDNKMVVQFIYADPDDMESRFLEAYEETEASNNVSPQATLALYKEGKVHIAFTDFEMGTCWDASPSLGLDSYWSYELDSEETERGWISPSPDPVMSLEEDVFLKRRGKIRQTVEFQELLAKRTQIQELAKKRKRSPKPNIQIVTVPAVRRMFRVPYDPDRKQFIFIRNLEENSYQAAIRLALQRAGHNVTDAENDVSMTDAKQNESMTDTEEEETIYASKFPNPSWRDGSLRNPTIINISRDPNSHYATIDDLPDLLAMFDHIIVDAVHEGESLERDEKNQGWILEAGKLPLVDLNTRLKYWISPDSKAMCVLPFDEILEGNVEMNNFSHSFEVTSRFPCP